VDHRRRVIALRRLFLNLVMAGLVPANA